MQIDAHRDGRRARPTKLQSNDFSVGAAELQGANFCSSAAVRHATIALRLDVKLMPSSFNVTVTSDQ